MERPLLSFNIDAVAAGALVFRRAREMRSGRELPTAWLLQDITT